MQQITFDISASDWAQNASDMGVKVLVDVFDEGVVRVSLKPRQIHPTSWQPIKGVAEVNNV